MLTFVIAVIVLVAILLSLVVLAQNSKGGGLTDNMSGTSQLMGARRATDWIEKATWTLAIALFVLTISTSVIINSSTPTQQGFSSPNIERAAEDAGAALPEADLNLEADEEATSEEATTEEGAE